MRLTRRRVSLNRIAHLTRVLLGSTLCALVIAGSADAQIAGFAGTGVPSPQVKGEIDSAMQAPTPHGADGHPDLTGFWKPAGGFGGAFSVGSVPPPQAGKNVLVDLPPVTVVDAADVRNSNARLANVNSRPHYKSASDQAKAHDNFVHADYLDPAYHCGPPGVARLGAPVEIIQGPKAIYFLYATQNRYRVIPTDGRAHDPSLESTTNGDSVGSWDGATLVVDTVNIDPTTWVDHDGSFHSKDLHVIERLTRKGGSLTYQVHLEDPIFAQPFDDPAQTLLVGSADQHVVEDYPCEERSLVHMVNDTRH